MPGFQGKQKLNKLQSTIGPSRHPKRWLKTGKGGWPKVNNAVNRPCFWSLNFENEPCRQNGPGRADGPHPLLLSNRRCTSTRYGWEPDSGLPWASQAFQRTRTARFLIPTE